MAPPEDAPLSLQQHSVVCWSYKKRTEEGKRSKITIFFFPKLTNCFNLSQLAIIFPQTQFARCFPLCSSIPPCVLFFFWLPGGNSYPLKKKKKMSFIDADSLQDVKRSGKNSDASCRRQTCARNRSALVEMTASAKVSSRAKNAPVHIFLLAVK